MTEVSEEVEIIIRDVEQIAELREVEELQRDVWGRSERDVVPFTQLVAARNVGGHVLGAFDGTRLAGFAYGFIGLRDGHTIFHSHMLAVRPAYRNARLGYQLKLAQRERVISQGLARMTWTFDPLQSLNANFNLAKLGVLSATYKINVYGEATSSFLHRNGTDRFFVTWLLDSPRVRRRIETQGVPTASQVLMTEATTLVRIGADDAPQCMPHNDALTYPHALIEIPADINLLQRERPELSCRWREATRAAFTDALAAGYVVCEFNRTTRDGRLFGTYLLSRGSLEDFRS